MSKQISTANARWSCPSDAELLKLAMTLAKDSYEQAFQAAGVPECEIESFRSCALEGVEEMAAEWDLPMVRIGRDMSSAWAQETIAEAGLPVTPAMFRSDYWQAWNFIGKVVQDARQSAEADIESRAKEIEEATGKCRRPDCHVIHPNKVSFISDSLRLAEDIFRREIAKAGMDACEIDPEMLARMRPFLEEDHRAIYKNELPMKLIIDSFDPHEHYDYAQTLADLAGREYAGRAIDAWKLKVAAAAKARTRGGKIKRAGRKAA